MQSLISKLPFMSKLKELDESQYKVDFDISKGYIDFSSELLRLSLLAMGSFGALVFIKIKSEAKATDPYFLQHTALFLISMGFFAFCAVATLFNRYFASDCPSWYISWLRALNKGKTDAAIRERKGFHNMLFLSKWALILSELLFGGGVLFFMTAIFKLLLN